MSFSNRTRKTKPFPFGEKRAQRASRNRKFVTERHQKDLHPNTSLRYGSQSRPNRKACIIKPPVSTLYAGVEAKGLLKITGDLSEVPPGNSIGGGYSMSAMTQWPLLSVPACLQQGRVSPRGESGSPLRTVKPEWALCWKHAADPNHQGKQPARRLHQ